MKFIFALVLIILSFQMIYAGTPFKFPGMPVDKSNQPIDPVTLRPYMFTQQITGQLNILIPKEQYRDFRGELKSQVYQIQMVKTTQQFLPPKLYNPTTIYAYRGLTNNGYIAAFPGPGIIATKDVPIKVTWKNNIKGSHILPVDYSFPFENTPAFINQVPAVPHIHGLAVQTISDGQPQAYWTYSGKKGQHYGTVYPCAKNQAVFVYENQQQAGNNWFHDHAIGITRLNVYAGLAGFYKIVDRSKKINDKQKQLVNKYGPEISQKQTKYLVVTDKTFKKNGQLYLPEESDNKNFMSWTPQFFGNTMTVNGVIWPKMNLKRGVYRFVLLNACISRYLNIFFENRNKKIPFQLVRMDNDYYKQQVIVDQLFLSPADRIELIIDLRNVYGEVILRNNAQAPYPMGQQQFLVPQFTGQLMKFVVKNSPLVENQNKPVHKMFNKKINYINYKYPAFKEGQKVFTTLIQIKNQDGDVQSSFIDGISMMNHDSHGDMCQNSTYKVGKVYDFYFINLTPDTHPIHFHLINMQKVKQFKFDVQKYKQKYFKINGGEPTIKGYSKPPISLDPQYFRTGKDQFPQPQQKVFKDTVAMSPQYVTVVRIKFAQNNGQPFKRINIKGQRYVNHCHMLTHQDNQMMKYFCLE